MIEGLYFKIFMKENQQLPAQPEAKPEDIINTLEGTFEAWLTIADNRASNAETALSRFTGIADDDTDEKARKALAKTGVTYTEIKEQRMAYTRMLDDVKDYLMGPERKISIEGKDNIYARVKKLRDAYANNKLQQQLAEQKQARLDKERDNELVRVRAAIKSNIANGVVLAVNKMNDSIRAYVAEMTIQNWDEKYKKFNVQPRLNPKTYDAFFDVPYNGSLEVGNEVLGIINEIRAAEDTTYENVNREYIVHASKALEVWRESLSERKSKLMQIEVEIAKGGESPIAEELREADEKIAADSQTRMQEIRDVKEKEIQCEADDAMLKNEFVEQIKTQEAEADLGGVRINRVAQLTCSENDIVKTVSRALLACYKHPKWPGHLKRDAKGKYKGPDENGHEVYADWLSPILSFLAKNSEENIEGIKLVETIKTTLR